MEASQIFHNVWPLARMVVCIYILGGCCSVTEFCQVQNSLCVLQVLRSPIGSVTARQSSSECEPNFAALSTGRHLYSAGRPSRWSLAIGPHSSFIRPYLCPVVWFLLFSSPNFSVRRLDVCHTSTHGVALVRIYNAGLKCAARRSLEMSSQLRHVSTIGKKLVKQQDLPRMSLQYGELRPKRLRSFH